MAQEQEQAQAQFLTDEQFDEFRRTGKMPEAPATAAKSKAQQFLESTSYQAENTPARRFIGGVTEPFQKQYEQLNKLADVTSQQQLTNPQPIGQQPLLSSLRNMPSNIVSAVRNANAQRYPGVAGTFENIGRVGAAAGSPLWGPDLPSIGEQFSTDPVSAFGRTIGTIGSVAPGVIGGATGEIPSISSAIRGVRDIAAGRPSFRATIGGVDLPVTSAEAAELGGTKPGLIGG